MIQKTKDYEIFKFREDNRVQLDKGHIQKLVKMIEVRNMLALRPILVNAEMEIIDGQHRLMAAKQLGVEIYYELSKEMTLHDVILMNTSKQWGIQDYMNFFCKNKYPEYLALADFIKANNISLRLGISMAMSITRQVQEKFRLGEFKFSVDQCSKEVEIIWDTISYIKKINGFSAYTTSVKFWQAMMMLTQDGNFDVDKWHENLAKFITRVKPQPNMKSYLKLFIQIHNWNNAKKIFFDDSEIASKSILEKD